MKKTAALILLSSLIRVEAQTQSLLNLNASNVSNFNSSFVFGNPSGIAYVQGFEGLVGIQRLYFGLAGDDLLNSIGAIIYRFSENDALGARAIHLTSNLLDQGEFSLMLARKFFDERLSLGLNANVLYYSYDVDKFTPDFDPRDPLITEGTAKTSLSFGASFLFWLSEALAAGLSIDDLNRPDISLDDSGFKKSSTYKIGAVYLHPLFSPQVDIQKHGNELSMQAGVHKSFFNKTVDVFTGYNAMGADGQSLFLEFSYMPGKWGLIYSLRRDLSELGEVSNGSHLLTLHYRPSGPAKAFTKPVVDLIKPDSSVIRSPVITIAGEARSRSGITKVEYRNNGIVKHVTLHDKEPSVPLHLNMQLAEDGNQIEVVAYAGKKYGSERFAVSHVPDVAPPTIAIHSNPDVTLDTAAYVLHVMIDDTRGLRSIRMVLNKEDLKTLIFEDKPVSYEINEPVSLQEGRNEIRIIAANDKVSSMKIARVEYVPKGTSAPPPEIRIISPPELKDLRMVTPYSVVRLEWEAHNVRTLEDLKFEVNDSLIALIESDIVRMGETSLMLRMDVINLKEGKNKVEIHAQSGHHMRGVEMEVFFNPLLGQKFYRQVLAVIIGINRYRDAAIEQLNLAVHDAKGVERTLREQFRIDRFITLYDDDATRSRVTAVLIDSMKNTHADDAVFVFFAGHGDTVWTDDGEVGYLIPHDGVKNSLASNIPVSVLWDAVRVARARHIFFVIDACFGGVVFAKRSGANPPPSQPAFNSTRAFFIHKGRYALTAGGPDERVLDGGLENHSIFTGRFLEGLRGDYPAADCNGDSYVTAHEISYYVVEKVPHDAHLRNARQTPRAGDLTGDDGLFIFMRREK